MVNDILLNVFVINGIYWVLIWRNMKEVSYSRNLCMSNCDNVLVAIQK